MVPILSIRGLTLKLEDGLSLLLITSSTNAMRGFAVAHVWLQKVSKRSTSKIGQLIPLHLCVPCFKLSHAFFKLAYLLNQRRLLRLCGQDFFLEFYGDRVASGRIADILQSYRKIEHSLERAKASEYFTDHEIRLSVLSTSAESVSRAA